MKTEWWYEDPTWHYSDHTVLSFARLVVRDDGTAQVFAEGGETREFENADEANMWLVDEEYRWFDILLEELAEDGAPLDPRIKIPRAASDSELLPLMCIDLSVGGLTLSDAPQARPLDSDIGTASHKSAS